MPVTLSDDGRPMVGGSSSNHGFMKPQDCDACGSLRLPQVEKAGHFVALVDGARVLLLGLSHRRAASIV